MNQIPNKLLQIKDFLKAFDYEDSFKIVVRSEYRKLPEVVSALDFETLNPVFLAERIKKIDFKYGKLNKDYSFSEFILYQDGLIDRIKLLECLIYKLFAKSILVKELIKPLIDKHSEFLFKKKNSIGNYNQWIRELETFYNKYIEYELKEFVPKIKLKIANFYYNSNEDINFLSFAFDRLQIIFLLDYIIECQEVEDEESYKELLEKVENKIAVARDSIRKMHNSYKTLLLDNLKKLKKEFKNKKINQVEELVDLFGKIMLNLYQKGPFNLDNEAVFNFSYDDEVKIFVVNAFLPSSNNISKVYDVLYIRSKNSLAEKELKDKDFKVLYEDVISQIILFMSAALYHVSSDSLIESILINGYVDGIDKATGKEIRNCIISVKIPKNKFNNINLEKVDPAECLKYFKARVASEFINTSPVAPILQFNKNDKRFIDTENIIDVMQNSTNLATIEWEKFEYLVRDLFSKMFSEGEVEVRVTRASRDKGVDAIVFDPDPIRGGKFVIQCKRYNNIVGVSDVRDLWGTVMHEGANKGILVTTSYFGIDSIEWSKDKPITLIDGNNLLSLFQKYGYNFKIELQK